LTDEVNWFTLCNFRGNWSFVNVRGNHETYNFGDDCLFPHFVYVEIISQNATALLYTSYSGFDLSGNYEEVYGL